MRPGGRRERAHRSYPFPKAENGGILTRVPALRRYPVSGQEPAVRQRWCDASPHVAGIESPSSAHPRRFEGSPMHHPAAESTKEEGAYDDE